MNYPFSLFFIHWKSLHVGICFLFEPWVFVKIIFVLFFCDMLPEGFLLGRHILPPLIRTRNFLAQLSSWQLILLESWESLLYFLSQVFFFIFHSCLRVSIHMDFVERIVTWCFESLHMWISLIWTPIGCIIC